MIKGKINEEMNLSAPHAYCGMAKRAIHYSTNRIPNSTLSSTSMAASI